MSQSALTLRETRGTVTEGWAVEAEPRLRELVREQRAEIARLKIENETLRLQLREADGVVPMRRRA